MKTVTTSLFVIYFFTFSPWLLAHKDYKKSTQSNCLAPMFSLNETFMELEKKELFLKNLFHSSSSNLFDFSDISSGLIAYLQQLSFSEKYENILNEQEELFFRNHTQDIFKLNENFIDIQRVILYSKNKDIDKLWIDFKKIAETGQKLSFLLKEKVELIQSKNSKHPDFAVANIGFEKILIYNTKLDNLLKITLACVEDNNSLFELLDLNLFLLDLKETFLSKKSNLDLKIEIDPDLFFNNEIILGNKMLLLNSLENFTNNARQHMRNTLIVKIYKNKKNRSIDFEFINDATPIDEDALHYDGSRKKLFYLNYSTKGMGVGTTFSWYISQFFNHAIAVKNLNNGVSFKYQIPILDSFSIDFIKKVIDRKFSFNEFEAIRKIYNHVRDVRTSFYYNFAVSKNSKPVYQIIHPIILSQLLTSNGISASVYMTKNNNKQLLNSSNPFLSMFLLIKTKHYLIDPFPETLGKIPEELKKHRITNGPIIIKLKDIERFKIYKNKIIPFKTSLLHKNNYQHSSPIVTSCA